jgi:hypothetical protein
MIIRTHFAHISQSQPAQLLQKAAYFSFSHTKIVRIAKILERYCITMKITYQAVLSFLCE